MPAAVLPETAFKGKKLHDTFNPKKKGANKVKQTGAPKKFTGPMGNVTGQKKSRRVQKLTKPPAKVKGAAAKPGEKRVVGHSMGGMFGFTPKKSEPDNRPPKQSEKRADSQARVKRLRGLLI